MEIHFVCFWHRVLMTLRRISMSLGMASVSQWAPGQPGLQNDTLSHKETVNSHCDPILNFFKFCFILLTFLRWEIHIVHKILKPGNFSENCKIKDF